MAKRIVLTGGLSGGHTFPLIAVAKALEIETKGDCEFLFLGSRGQFEEKAMEEAGIPSKFIVTAKWRRYFSLQNFFDLFKLPFAFLQALWYLLSFMPDAVFSKGGAASVPIALAAWIYRIPILLHDSDAVAGKANRFVAHFASRIAIAYESAREYFPANKIALTGNPVREAILKGDAARGLESFGFVADRPVLLVIGGSLGAMRLNKSVVRMAPDLTAAGYQIVHLTGELHLQTVQEEAVSLGMKPGLGYIAIPFLLATELADAYQAASIVLSRAGAGTIAELAALAKTAILVPLPTAANDEQRKNAYEIEQHGGAIVVEEHNLGSHILMNIIGDIVSHPERSKKMGETFRQYFSHPDAAVSIARGLISLY